MKIKKDDYQFMLGYLINKREEGQEFVAFFDSPAPVERHELFTFSDHYDVQEFCHEMTTDIDMYSYLAIRSAYRAMSEALKETHC